MYLYILDLVDRKEHDPGDDLISRLVTDYVTTGQLNRATAAMSGVIMMQAGHETTANMIALGTVALLEHREVFERLGQTDDPAVIVTVPVAATSATADTFGCGVASVIVPVPPAN